VIGLVKLAGTGNGTLRPGSIRRDMPKRHSPVIAWVGRDAGF
jgi:hypothetical protein